MGLYDLLFHLMASAVGFYTGRHAKQFLWKGPDPRKGSPEESFMRVRKFYELNADLEEERLTKSLCAKIEFEVMKRFLHRYLPPSGHMLDIGCSTGAYLKYLAEKGYQVSGIDLSRPAIDRARTRLNKSGLGGRIAYLETGNACDLSVFPSGSFDAVLSFGPFYHIIDRELREHAFSEISRVLKPKGLVFATFVSRFAPIIQGIALYPYFFTETAFSESLRTGIRYAGGSKYHTDLYTASPDEVRTFFTNGQFLIHSLAAVEGLSAWRVWEIERAFREEEIFYNLIDVLVSAAEEPSLLGATIQILCVGQKTLS